MEILSSKFVADGEKQAVVEQESEVDFVGKATGFTMTNCRNWMSARRLFRAGGERRRNCSTRAALPRSQACDQSWPKPQGAIRPRHRGWEPRKALRRLVSAMLSAVGIDGCISRRALRSERELGHQPGQGSRLPMWRWRESGDEFVDHQGARRARRSVERVARFAKAALRSGRKNPGEPGIGNRRLLREDEVSRGRQFRPGL